jgi:hypothetical protein
VVTPAPGAAEIVAAIAARDVQRLRHFTTNAGITGILATGEVRSRSLLAADAYLDRIYYPNCETRVDPRWTGHVSVSVTDINDAFFSICSGSATWHRGMDGFWAVVEFDPILIAHRGVWFATTNNRYSNVSRQQGRAGFDAMFADVVHPFRPISRSPVLIRDGLSAAQPTDPQAELLYPEAIPVEFIRAILVSRDEDAHSVASQLGVFARHHQALSHVQVRVDATAFERRIPGLLSLPPGADLGT